MQPQDTMNLQLNSGDKFDYAPWEGVCNLIEVAGEFWMLREGYDSNGTHCWKTQDGAGAKLKMGEMVHILWDNSHSKILASMTRNGDI